MIFSENRCLLFANAAVSVRIMLYLVATLYCWINSLARV